MNLPEVKLAPTPLLSIGDFHLTSGMLGAIITSFILIVIALIIRKNAGIRPSKPQIAFELIYNFIADKMVLSFGSIEEARKYLPLIFTFFIFLLFANQFSLLPLLNDLILSKQDGSSVNIFSAPSAHYSMTIGFAILIILATHIIALFMNPGKHISNYIQIPQFFKLKSIKELPMQILNFFLGILDLVGEIAKLISLSTRLFGNMFAGTVVVLIISSLSVFTKFLAPLPFLALSTVSGLVQSFVFMMLSTIYISSAVKAVKQSTT